MGADFIGLSEYLLPISLFPLRYSRFSNKYNFEKPNDRRALELMNAAAIQTMRELPDINFAYGVSDEFRFV